MGRYDMIAFVVLVLVIGSVLRAAFGARHRRRDREIDSSGTMARPPRLRDEVKQLKERLHGDRADHRREGKQPRTRDRAAAGPAVKAERERASEMNNGSNYRAVIIVAIVMIAGIFKARFRYAHKYGGRISDERIPAARAEAERLREEVKQLKERLQVLERITVEKESASSARSRGCGTNRRPKMSDAGTIGAPRGGDRRARHAEPRPAQGLGRLAGAAPAGAHPERPRRAALPAAARLELADSGTASAASKRSPTAPSE